MTSEPRKVALVTGGAKRVGRAIVERLAAAGFDIAFTYLNSEFEAVALGEQLAVRGRESLAIRVDLLDQPNAAAEIGARFREKFDRLDVLVNNASLYMPGDLQQTDLAQLRKLMTIHVETPMLLCQQFAAPLRAARGHVINMLDLLAERPWPKYLGYCASKAALANMTLSLSRELAPDVTVNGIAPGVVEWPPDYPPSEQANYLKRVPLGRAGSPQDVAELIAFLCAGGSYITGQILRVDGGRSIT